MCTPKEKKKNVFSNTVHNGKNQNKYSETGNNIDSYTVVYGYNGIVCSSKSTWSLSIPRNMAQTWEHTVNYRKQVVENSMTPSCNIKNLVIHM